MLQRLIRLEWSRLGSLGPIDGVIVAAFCGLLVPAVVAPWITPVALPFVLEILRRGSLVRTWRATDEFVQLAVGASGLARARWLFELECLFACSVVASLVYAWLGPSEHASSIAVLSSTLALSLSAQLLRLLLGFASLTGPNAVGTAVAGALMLAAAAWSFPRAVALGPWVCAAASLGATLSSGWLTTRALAQGSGPEPAGTSAGIEQGPASGHRTLIGALVANDARLILRTGLWRRMFWVWLCALLLGATLPVPMAGFALALVLALAQFWWATLWGGGEAIGTEGFARNLRDVYAAPIPLPVWYRARTLVTAALVAAASLSLAVVRVWLGVSATEPVWDWAAFVAAALPLALLQGGWPPLVSGTSRRSVPFTLCWAIVLWQLLWMMAWGMSHAVQEQTGGPAFPSPLELLARAMQAAPIASTLTWLGTCALAFWWSEREFVRYDIRRVQEMLPRPGRRARVVP